MSGADGFYPAGTSIQLTAAPAAGFQFTGWSGNVVSADNPLTFQLNSPSTITANFSGAPASVTITSNVSAQFTIAGAGCPAGTYTASTSVIWTCWCRLQRHGNNASRRTGHTAGFCRLGQTERADESAKRNCITGAVFGMLFTTEHKLTRIDFRTRNHQRVGWILRFGIDRCN